ncbi:MAG: tRNA pseudouridine(55) synthase TruB [Pirellulales bacterium]
MFGILNINKPPGCTSRDVVNQVQRLLRGLGHGRGLKLGHAGTLDPLATGVLVVCIGPATRLISHVQQMPKQYVGTFLLGRQSDSYDVETPCRSLDDAPQPSLADLNAKLPAFLGVIEQTPPTYSAVKIAGRRAYDLARQGKTVEITPRPVTIHSLEITRYEYPELELSIRCGSGTYVRSLGHDLAVASGTDAVMAALTRTAIGAFTLKEALAPEQLTAENLAGQLLPAIRAVDHLPQVALSDTEVAEIRQGKRIDRGPQPGDCEIAAVEATGELVALLESRGCWLAPKTVFMPPQAPC